MNAEQHGKETNKLHELEDKLIKLIAKNNDGELMDIFTEWQSQRHLCNEGYLKWMESFLSKSPQLESKDASEFFKEYTYSKGKGAVTLNVIEFAEAYHKQASIPPVSKGAKEEALVIIGYVTSANLNGSLDKAEKFIIERLEAFATQPPANRQIELLETLKGLLNDFSSHIGECDCEPQQAGYMLVAEDLIKSVEANTSTPEPRELPTEEQGYQLMWKLIAELPDKLNESEEPFFIAGFQEVLKYMRANPIQSEGEKEELRLPKSSRIQEKNSKL